MNTDNKRIAKNTLMLYIRMLFTTVVSLITVRIVLDTLGVVDYGINNVVGGIVIMFSFLSGSMVSASQRFFAFELGRNNILQLKRVFSLFIIIYLIIAVGIFILSETIGLWFLNNKMAIPIDRIEAANWVYQFSILSFLLTIMSIPYNAAIVAHESFNVYAYVSILESVLKLVMVYLLVLFPVDKLKLYAILLFITTCIIVFIYRTICKRKYEECQFEFYWERSLFNTILSYSGWNLIGAVSGVMNSQGINILLNIFFGPIVNTARAIAFQVNAIINQFVMNFFKAVQPQIIKYYASSEHMKMMNLVFKSSKLSYFLLFFLSMPLLLETNYILSLWLKEIPEYVVLFTRLVIITALIDSLSYPLQTAAQATGNIKKYQIVVGGMMLLNLPISYVFLKLGYPPQSTMYISIGISITCLFLRLFLLQNLVGLSIQNYLLQVLKVIFIVSLSSYLIPVLFAIQVDESLTRFLVVGFLGIITSLLSIYFLGLTKSERTFFNKIIINKLSSLLNHEK